MKPINILILSCGTRNKVVRYFCEELHREGLGKVIATDCSPLAPALYEADRFHIVPRMTEDNYLSVVYEICKEERVSGVLSLIDPELNLLAAHINEFKQLGVGVIGSNLEACDTALNKYKMFQWLDEHGYRCARSYTELDEFKSELDSGAVKFPVYVKPIFGSASIAINKAVDLETVCLLLGHNNELMVQEYLDGQEIGVDVYIDLISGEVVSIFAKKKIKMRAGETDKSVSFKDQRLFKVIERFVKEMGYRGQIDIDVFDVEGEYYISEVNPRFGGGYPHAHEAGANHVKLIVNNMRGLENQPEIGDNYQDGVFMMKYSEVLCGTLDELQGAEVNL